MIWTRQLIFTLYIVFYFVNYATSMKESGSTSKEDLKELRGVNKCIEILKAKGYTDNGFENSTKKTPTDSNVSAAEILYVEYLDTLYIYYLGVTDWCEVYWRDVAKLSKLRDAEKPTSVEVLTKPKVP